jgi:hypothetical protein
LTASFPASASGSQNHTLSVSYEYHLSMENMVFLQCEMSLITARCAKVLRQQLQVPQQSPILTTPEGFKTWTTIYREKDSPRQF